MVNGYKIFNEARKPCFLTNVGLEYLYYFSHMFTAQLKISVYKILCRETVKPQEVTVRPGDQIIEVWYFYLSLHSNKAFVINNLT